MDKKWIRSSLIRAFDTLLTTLAAFIIFALITHKIDVLLIYGIPILSFALSFLVSCLGFHETTTDGTLRIDRSDPKKDTYLLKIDIPLEDLSSKKIVRFVVEDTIRTRQ